MIIFLTQLPWWVKVGYASWISVGYLLLSFPLQFVLLILIWKTARHTSQTNGQTFVIWIAALLAVLSCVEAFGFYVCNFVGYFDGLVPPSNVLAIICLLFVIRHSFSVPVWTTVLAVLADWFANWLLVRYGAVYLLKLAIVIVFTSPMIFFIIKRPCLRDALRAQR